VSNMTNYYVTTNPDRGWNAKRENADRASGVYNTQEEARQHATQFAKHSGGGEVRVQNQQGRFRASNTVPPAIDHFPPRG